MKKTWGILVLSLMALGLLFPAAGSAEEQKLWDRYDKLRAETQKKTDEMFRRFQDDVNKKEPEGPATMDVEQAEPIENVAVNGLVPVDIQPWKLQCPPGYDNGTYKGTSYCIKCPPNSTYRSTQGACVGCPPGYASDYDRPGELCFSCPPGFQAGYIQDEVGGARNACAKCPIGYTLIWKDDRPFCERWK